MLGVPVESAALKGLDSLLSIVQMPAGIPVGTLAIGRAGAINAALWPPASSVLATPRSWRRSSRWRARQTAAVAKARRTTPAPSSLAHEPAKLSPPGSTIGILGGGQLGRMTALAAARLGYRSLVYAPEADSIAGHVAAGHVSGAYDDAAALARFAAQVDVITYEFENVPEADRRRVRAPQAGAAGRAGRSISPSTGCARRTFFRQLGIGTAELPADRQRRRPRRGDRAARHPEDLHRGL